MKMATKTAYASHRDLSRLFWTPFSLKSHTGRFKRDGYHTILDEMAASTGFVWLIMSYFKVSRRNSRPDTTTLDVIERSWCSTRSQKVQCFLQME